MRFVDFLKATVLASAGAATLLALVTVLGATQESNDRLVLLAAGWWTAALAIGLWIGRRSETSPPIAGLLAGARTQRALPDLQPGLLLLNRLWPLVVATLIAGGLGFVLPQVSAVAAGFAIIWSLAWRRQDAAVLAIEERDGCRFYVDRTSPVAPIRLIRTPGFGGHFAGF